jgi:hypothetical protein
MSAPDFVISSKSKMRNGDVGNNRANSEAVQTKYSANINSLIDSSFFPIDVSWDGYFSTDNLFTKAPIRIEKLSDVIWYQLSIFKSGSGSGNNGVNFAVYDDSGAFVGNLFGGGANRISISSDSGTNVLVGRNVDTATNFNTNAAGHTVQSGVLAISTLQPGYMLVPFVEQFSTNARSMRFRMHIREQ